MAHERPYSTPHSEIPAQPLTLKQAAEQAGCSVSLVRKLVRAHEVPSSQEQTNRGFRYVIPPEALPVLAHKVAMRKPGFIAAPAPGLLGSQRETSEMTPDERLELERLRAQNELLGRENERLWQQVNDLTATVQRLALPAHQSPSAPGPPKDQEPEPTDLRPSRREAETHKGARRPPPPPPRVLDAGATAAMVARELQEWVPAADRDAPASPPQPGGEPHWTLKIAEAMNPDLKPKPGPGEAEPLSPQDAGLLARCRRFWISLVGPSR